LLSFLFILLCGPYLSYMLPLLFKSLASFVWLYQETFTPNSTWTILQLVVIFVQLQPSYEGGSIKQLLLVFLVSFFVTSVRLGIEAYTFAYLQLFIAKLVEIDLPLYTRTLPSFLLNNIQQQM